MSKKFTPSVEQADFLNWIVNGHGSAVLEAVAGAGKTTTLVEGVKLMKGSVFLGAYNKKMGEELKAKTKDIPNVKAGTLHAAGFSALNYAAQGKLEINDKKVYDLISPVVEARNLESEYTGAACKLVSLAKQTGFYVQTLVPTVPLRFWMELVHRYDIADTLPEDADVEMLCDIAAGALKLSNINKEVIDFDDMVYLPLLRNLRMFKNDWVLLDEAQDTNAVRRELAGRMLKPGGRLVAVGDLHQAIYGFTGADNRSLQMIKDKFDAVTLKLSVSWRCPKAVVEVARQYVDHISPAPTAQMGNISAVFYKKMLETVAPGEAVLCRFNAPLIDLCFRLIRDGKPARIEGRAIGESLVALISRWKVKSLDALEGRLEKWMDREKEKIEAAPKKDDAKLERLEDKYATIRVLIERAREQGINTVEALKEMVLEMFADVGASKTTVVLSSVHRSKGLEWNTVYILGRGEIMPPKREMQEWQMEQEINLCYVAVTRAQFNLIDVRMPTPEDLKRPEVKKEEKEKAA